MLPGFARMRMLFVKRGSHVRLLWLKLSQNAMSSMPSRKTARRPSFATPKRTVARAKWLPALRKQPSRRTTPFRAPRSLALVSSRLGLDERNQA